jgi:hypothetical protein
VEVAVDAPPSAAASNRDAGRDDASGPRLFWTCAFLALVLHASLLLSASGIRGGGDLVPHLRLIQQMGEAPALRNVYAPAYHVLGALIAPLSGLAAYPRLFAFGSALALIFGFRFFQRAARLPDAAAALFALSPYSLTLSYCLPKAEFAGHAVGLVGLGLLLKKRYVGVALAVVAAFWVHTAAALVFGAAAGMLALATRDARAIAALAAGTLLALPLFAAHVADGCTVPEAFLFSRSGYLGPGLSAPPLVGSRGVSGLLARAGPIALVVAVFGATTLWRHHRPLAVMGVALLVLYLNNVWLAPFGKHTAVGLARGLSVLAIPVAIAAGVAIGQRRRLRALVLAGCAVYALGAAVWIVPDSCFVRPVALREIEGLRVARCTFSWSGPNLHRRPKSRRPAARGARVPRQQPPVER